MKDVLSDILDTIELKGALYFRTDFSPPFAVGVPAYGKAARFHLAVQGRCHVTLPGEADVLLQPGDLIVIPYGTSHVLSDVAGRDAVPLENIMASTGYTGEGAFVIGSGDPTASTQLVCGHPPRSAVLMHESSDTRPRTVVPDWRVETLQIVPISPLIVPVCSRDIAGQSLFNA